MGSKVSACDEDAPPRLMERRSSSVSSKKSSVTSGVAVGAAKPTPWAGRGGSEVPAAEAPTNVAASSKGSQQQRHWQQQSH